MKKITIALVGLLAAGGLYAADVTQTSASIDTFINDLDFKAEAIEVANELVVDVAAVIANANSAAQSQVNTNANVDLTLVTPTEAGSVLYAPNATNTFDIAGVGATNTYTLRVAIAVGTTTNDWVKLPNDQ